MEGLKGKLLAVQRYYQSGVTKDPGFVREYLLKLKSVLIENEEEIYHALYTDLRKNPAECYSTEIAVVMNEINFMLKNMDKLRKPQKTASSLVNFPSGSYLYPDPLGKVLIISPWNYPLNLSLTPLAGAIAAGNVVVLKPSEKSIATSQLIEKLIKMVFPEEYVLVVNGEGSVVIPDMMQEIRFDHIFFTGNNAVGKMIYKQAAENLIPVTLELGGKNPAIVTDSSNLKIAAKRIALAKFVNAGQTCLAPDYVIVHESVKHKFIEAIKLVIYNFYGDNPLESTEYGKLIEKNAFDRVIKYLNEGKIQMGGNYDEEKLMIEPTIITDLHENSALMKDEIFGPVLPVLGYSAKEDLDKILSAHGQPLGMYLFTKDKEIENQFIKNYSFGGGCINNAAMHFLNHNFPFGGIGSSGIGAYHGKFSFDRFTHYKPVLKTPEWPDPSIKYPPFKNKLKWFKKLL